MKVKLDEYDKTSLDKIQKRREDSSSYVNLFVEIADVELSETEARKESRGVENYLIRKMEIGGEEIEDSRGKYKESIEIKSDGTQVSDKLIEINEAQMKDGVYLLEAHGYNPYKFELLNARNNLWNVYSKIDGVQTLYSSKISIKPKVQEFDIEWAKDVFKELPSLPKAERLLESLNGKMVFISLADLHYGLRSSEYEDETKKIFDDISLRYRDADVIVVPIGNDLCHFNTVIGATPSTVKGTGLEATMEYDEMFKSALRSMAHLIDRLLENTSAKIQTMYIPSNHDTYSTFGIYQSLIQRYINNPNITFDDSMKFRKYIGVGKVGLMVAHGDSEAKRIFQLFPVEAPEIFASSTCREGMLYHLHNETVKDEAGVTYRRLPTMNKPDKWHDQKGFVGAPNRMQVFVYDTIKGRLNTIDQYYLED